MRASLSQPGIVHGPYIRTRCDKGALFTRRRKACIPQHRNRGNNGRTIASSMNKPSERWLSFWSTIDATAWLGTVAAGFGLLVTQEAILLGFPLILPLIALYASRERGRLERQGIQATLQSQINSTLNQVVSTSKEASNGLAEEILSILEDFSEDITSSNGLVSFDKKISALEGTLTTSTSSVIDAVTTAAGENEGQLKELSSLIRILRNELVAISRQSGKENIEFLDDRLARLEGSISGLKDAQTGTIKHQTAQIASLFDERAETQLGLSKELKQQLIVLRQDILKRFDETNETNATREDLFEKILGEQSDLILGFLKVQERSILEALETRNDAVSSSSFAFGHQDLDGKLDEFIMQLESSSANTSNLKQEIAGIREENSKLSKILQQNLEFQERTSQGMMDASTVFVIMQTIVKQLEILRQDIHRTFKGFNDGNGNAKNISGVQDLEAKLDKSISSVLDELTRMSLEPYITGDERKYFPNSESYKLANKPQESVEYAALDDKLNKVLSELEVLQWSIPKEVNYKEKETDSEPIINGGTRDFDDYRVPVDDSKSESTKIKQAVREDASSKGNELAGLPKFSDFVQSRGSGNVSPETVVQPIEINSGGISNEDNTMDIPSDYAEVPDLVNYKSTDSEQEIEINHIDDEARYQEALHWLREGRLLADSEDSMASLTIAKELLEKAATVLDGIASVSASSEKVLGNCGNALLALGRVNLQIYEKQSASDANSSQEPDPAYEKDAEKLLIRAGRRYLEVLQLDSTQGRAFFNWGRAVYLRGELATARGKYEEGCALFANAAEKFEAAFQSGFEDGEAYYLAGSSLLSAATRATCSVEDTYHILEVAESFLSTSIEKGIHGDARAKQQECLKLMT